MAIFDEKLWTEDHNNCIREFAKDISIRKIFFWVEEDGMKFTF